jgi:biopolymer transport protein ExbB/TolQ
VNWRVAVAQPAAERAATAVHAEMARGLFGLATVTSTAPFLGIFGNLLGIYGAFGGGSGEKTAIMAAIARGLSESIWPTALGLGIAVLAMAGHRLFSAQLATIDTEMRGAILQMTNDLARLPASATR